MMSMDENEEKTFDGNVCTVSYSNCSNFKFHMKIQISTHRSYTFLHIKSDKLFALGFFPMLVVKNVLCVCSFD